MNTAYDARVAVITRTKDRPILLPRAFESIQSQTFKDLIWVVINDGGDPHPVEALVNQARSTGIGTKVTHSSQSVGMEAASNMGIAQVASEYIVIHDDDDTWEPDFLRRTVTFLDNQEIYGGVVTHTTRIDEVITEDGWKILKKSPHNYWLNAVYLSDLAHANSFSTNSFLFRRKVCEEIKGFNESLPVLGDWDFNLRFLMHADIAVIPEPLANYHCRVNTLKQQGEYENTLTASTLRHCSYNAIIRNNFLRSDFKEGRIGLGCILAMGRNYSLIYDQYTSILESRSWKITAPLRYVYRLFSRIF
jgi:glycosyltransferase involved in cell wall biosynthesis